jgi:hypothetical protein
MLKLKNAAFLLLAPLLTVGFLLAQDTATQTVTMRVSEICVIDVTGNPSVLVIVPPSDGGDTPANPSDSSTYAQYTSVVASGKTRSITAQWAAGDAAPSGCELQLQAQPAGGNQGTSAGTITLSSTPQNIVTGIGSCATGRGSTQGARLTYTLVINDVESLVAGEEKTVTVTLTLTDDA